MNCLHIEAFLIANASGGIIWAAAFGIGGYFFGKLLLQLHHVPWSTLCRADWVRNDPVFYTGGWLLRHYDPGFPGAARGHAAASEHQGGIVDGPWARGGDCGSTSPRSQDELTQLRDAYSPLFACDDCTFVDQFIARRLRSFLLPHEPRALALRRSEFYAANSITIIAAICCPSGACLAASRKRAVRLSHLSMSALTKIVLQNSR